MRHSAALLLFLASACLLSGCAAGNAPAGPAAAVAGSALHGSVLGGFQPIEFASIQLYAPGTGDYGTAAVPLLRTPVTTDATGSFSITGDYTCPSAATPVYLTVNGGNPGLAAGVNNPAIALMDVLGPCGNLTPGTFVTINERTTVAGIYALQPFMSSLSAVSAPPASTAGLAAAFNNALLLVTSLGGTPGLSPAGATVPVAEIDTLADALSACVNTNGSTGPNTACGGLFTAATPAAGAAPLDVAAAMLNIARNPGRNVAGVFNVIVPSAPYRPVLSVAPADWTLAVNYTATALRGPADLALDAQGTVWTIATPGTLLNGSSTLSAVTSTGGLGAVYPQQFAAYANVGIDAIGNIWLSNSNASTVVAFTPSGTRVSTAPYTGGGLTGPGPLAFDAAGNVWVSNNNGTVSELNSSGAAVSPASGYGTGVSSGPAALALDTTGSVWTTDAADNVVIKLTSAGKQVGGSPYADAGGPFSVAIDGGNNAWVANRTSSTVTQYGSGGAVLATLQGAGLGAPLALVLDGVGTVWVANGNSNTVSVLNVNGAAGSMATSINGGYGSAFLLNPYKLAIDQAGSVWVANLGTKVAGSGTITQIIGAAAPVVTPLAVAVRSGKLAQRP